MVKGGGGKIVNIASLSGQRGGHGRAAYGAAKAGLELLTKVMAVELAEYGINVNNIAPGAIETEMAKFAHDAPTRAAYNYLIPMTRYGTPEEIADAAVFLCSDESRYVHGHTLNVDGGFRAAGLMFRAGKAVPLQLAENQSPLRTGGNHAQGITRRSFAALAGGTAITAALPIGYAHAAEHTFKIGTNVPASHPLNVHLTKAAEQVKAETNGRSSFSSSPTTSSAPIPTCCRSFARARWNAS